MNLNLGCGTVQFEGWDNLDSVDYGQNLVRNILTDDVSDLGPYEFIFCNHLLSCFTHHQLVGVLAKIGSLLADGGTARLLVPDAAKAAWAYVHRIPDFFPLGDDLPGLDERFCTFVPWFGESLSIFTRAYLIGLCKKAGFSHAEAKQCGTYERDDRCKEALVVEVTK